jgi:hypothetical protein
MEGTIREMGEKCKINFVRLDNLVFGTTHITIYSSFLDYKLSQQVR